MKEMLPITNTNTVDTGIIVNITWISEPIFMKLGMYIMPTRAISVTYFMNLINNTNTTASQIVDLIHLMWHTWIPETAVMRLGSGDVTSLICITRTCEILVYKFEFIEPFYWTIANE
jgi:hypothetical protein